MEKYTRKQLRNIGNAERFHARVRRWQEEHHTSAIPSADGLGVECIGYSCNYEGCNGSLFRDTKTGELFGIASRDYTIYIR